MTPYACEQIEAFLTAHFHLTTLTSDEQGDLKSISADYMAFRREVSDFQIEYFNTICTSECYRNQRSGCCQKEGIITFFADMVINLLFSEPESICRLLKALEKTTPGNKCIYLSEDGCLWHVKPIVCEMFLCDQAKREVFENHPLAAQVWDEFKKREKTFKYPDRPVLFDQIESWFLNAGYCSGLMYLHNSPGLLMLKQKSGLLNTKGWL